MTPSRAAWLVALCFLTAPVRAAGPPVGKMTPEDFERLSPDATFEVSGRRMTKREFLATMDRMKAQAGPSGALAKTNDSVHAELSNAARARVIAENGRLKPGPVTNPQVATCDTPRITSIEYTPPLDPGERVVIKGCGFQPSGLGNDPVLKLQLAEGWRGLSYVNGGARSPWQIVAEVSWDLTGVGDQQASVVVQRPYDGNSSNPFPVQFRAARDWKTIPRDEVTVHCAGEHPADNTCGGSSTYTVAAEHWGWVGLGNDTVSASVRNGWTFIRAGFEQTEPNIPPRKNRFAQLSGFQPGSASANLSVLWLFALQHGDIGVRYHIELVAEGIRGTSYK